MNARKTGFDLMRFSIFVSLGVSRIRLTGGEPLVRARFSELVGGIGKIQGLEDLSLSTNGTLLKRHVHALKNAGVSRLNVSLDTLSRERFAKLTRRDVLPDVLEGLAAAHALGFRLIKINMVWLPEVNGDEVDDMVEYCRERDFVLRLIENMPVGATARQLGSYSLQPLIAKLREKHQLVDDIVSGGGPARYLSSPDRRFSVGFITPISQHFCETCNRVRISASGTLHLCLGQEHQVELLPLLRSPENSDDEIGQVIRQALDNKPLKHEFIEAPEKIVRFMSSTGG
jgi:cyclic pyranopterin phosphate synthase